jgi:hypothetical protein
MSPVAMSLRHALLVPLAAALVASSAAAQGRSAEDARAIDGYRLTMPIIRRVLPAMYAMGRESCRSERVSDVHALGLAEMTRRIERCAPVVQSLRQRGVAPRDAALFYASMLRVSQQLALKGGDSSALPPGVIRDNALLLERNEREIRQITETAEGS